MMTDGGKSKYSKKNLLQFHLGNNKSPNVAAQWLALLLPIWEVWVQISAQRLAISPSR
jgi:hypothetical protein